MKKYFYWFGIIGAILYIAAVILGGFLIPNYSHIDQAISEIEPLLNDNNHLYITILFTLYNVFILIYGLLLFAIKNNKKTLKVQAITISLLGLLGLLTYFFPMDIVGERATTKGFIHIILAGIMAPLTILCTLLGFWTFKGKMKLYSLITCIMILIFGPLAAYMAANNMATGVGLFERITIGSFIIWLFITGLYYKKLYDIEKSEAIAK